MKTLSAVLLLAILCSHQLVSSAIIPGLSVDCCPKYHKGIIPIKQIVSYYKTSSDCPKQAIVFRTRRNSTFCVEEHLPWVQKHIVKLQLALAMTTTQTTP
ncbi:C-C motif chemokine 18-like [Scleropages formosus]|uniref:C-C motif chemokine 18-like n=1 Tax=Scleropages formosus TaxID=113540 RepID=UPI0008785346|nr:C-C motif chemokine 18-like [Scleropages formosus]